MFPITDIYRHHLVHVLRKTEDEADLEAHNTFNYIAKKASDVKDELSGAAAKRRMKKSQSKGELGSTFLDNELSEQNPSEEVPLETLQTKTASLDGPSLSSLETKSLLVSGDQREKIIDQDEMSLDDLEDTLQDQEIQDYVKNLELEENVPSSSDIDLHS